jgi:hypothetical protein
MTPDFDPQLSILPKAQLELLPELEPSVDLGFVLYGGTAIALRLGHRQSIDFDFFTDQALDKDLLIRSLPFLADANVIQESIHGLTVLTETGVKLSFFGTIDSGRISTPELMKGGNILVASLLDLFATKLKVVLQRIEWKDYFDIAKIIQSGLPLEAGIGAARALYGNRFQPSECLKALVYFEGGDLTNLDDTLRNLLIDSVSKVSVLQRMERISDTLN